MSCNDFLNNSNIICWTIVLTFFAVSVQAQEEEIRRNALYFEAGINYSAYHPGNARRTYLPSTSYTHAIGFKRALSNRLAIRTQVQQIKQGMNGKILITDYLGNVLHESRFLQRAEYVMIPLFFEQSFSKRRGFKCMLGGYAAYNYKSYVIMESFGLYPGDYQDVTASTAKFDGGLQFGIGFSVPIGNLFYLNFELMDAFGLANVLPESFGVRAYNGAQALIGMEWRF